ncbi:hypothetical protein AMJ49_01340 [Parcubacteria bacterium DG_74_2]|nr:MAG: hypothetical protein AMJ49_01340 [Parcubacteria bacterium DG_74_2]
MKRKWFIGVHWLPHPDELIARWMFQRGFGEKKFPGSTKAQVMFLDSTQEITLPPGSINLIPVGAGKQQFDEHRSYQETDRIPGECAATLVAKELGIDEDPQLREILEYVLLHDSRGILNRLDLADCINSLNQQYPTDSQHVLEIGTTIVDALYDYTHETTQEDRDKVAQFIDEWAQGKDELKAGQIIRFAKGLRHGNKKPFDLTYIFCALEKKYDREKVEAIVKELLEAKYFIQKKFFEAATELKKKLELREAKIVPVIRDKTILNVLKIESDNPQIAKVARHQEFGCDASVVIQKNGSGRVLIFTNNRFYTAQDMLNIAATIRLEELLQEKKLIIGYRKLSRAGIVREVPNWYFQRERNPGGGKLLNGSLTARDIEPTKIPVERILEIATTVLRLGKNFRWGVWLRNQLTASSNSPLFLFENRTKIL